MHVIAAKALLVGGPNVLAWLILGGLAGTIAGRLLYGRAFGFIGNISWACWGPFSAAKSLATSCPMGVASTSGDRSSSPSSAHWS